MTEEEAGLALLYEYLEADKRYKEKMGKHFHVEMPRPGEKIEGGAPLTPEAFEEIDRLRREAREKEDRWLESIRKRPSG